MRQCHRLRQSGPGQTRHFPEEETNSRKFVLLSIVETNLPKNTTLLETELPSVPNPTDFKTFSLFNIFTHKTVVFVKMDVQGRWIRSDVCHSLDSGVTD